MTHSTHLNPYIVIPAWNEEKTLKDVVEGCLLHGLKVIVVDDCSTDNTISTIQHLPINILKHSKNQGKSAALITGFKEALKEEATHIITLDADGQHDSKDILPLLKLSHEHPQALIIAARLLERNIVPRSRRFGNSAANFWISVAARAPIPDTQSGFRLYPSSFLKRLPFQELNQKSFVFESEVLILAARNKFSIKSIPIVACYPENRRKSYFHPVKDVWSIVTMVTKYLFLSAKFS